MSESKVHEWKNELRDDRFYESLLDKMRFEDLLSVAEQLCLTKSPDYMNYELSESAQSDVIASLGVLGLRYAIELSEGFHNGYEPSDDTPLHPLWQPELFSGPLNREMLAKASAFGARLIEESYEIIGKDADSWVEEYKRATNDEEQIVVLEKLHWRLHELGHGNRGMEEDSPEEGFYHPIRISPKVIGSYPDHTFSPTCLGIAAIGAGFLKRAGATFLHAGIMQTSLQAEEIDTYGLIKNADTMCEALGVTIPSELAFRLEDKLRSLGSIILFNNGTHSALMVRLSSGAWYQFDPNLNQSTELSLYQNEEENILRPEIEALNRSYDNLLDFKETAPGLELSAVFNNISFQAVWPEYIEDLGAINSIEVHRALRRNSGSITEKIRSCVVDDYLLHEANASDSLNRAIKEGILENITEETADGEEELLLNQVAREAIQKFVFWEMSEEEWQRVFETDEDFQLGAIEDIRRLPALIGIMYGLKLLSHGSLNLLHPRMELGLPETSIGLAALHNFGLLLDNGLSIYHWFSQWPSRIVLPDMMHKELSTPSEERTMLLHTKLLARPGALAYTHVYDKICRSMLDDISES